MSSDINVQLQLGYDCQISQIETRGRPVKSGFQIKATVFGCVAQTLQGAYLMSENLNITSVFVNITNLTRSRLTQR